MNIYQSQKVTTRAATATKNTKNTKNSNDLNTNKNTSINNNLDSKNLL